jgi:hypothetical protein
MAADERARLLLKARPTPRQLADRLRPVDRVWPDGLELYLAAADLSDARQIDAMVERLLSAGVPENFVWLIEGPVDSLDGEDFDVTRDSAADRLVIQRLGEIAKRIGARAVNIHVIAPGADLSRLSLDCRAELLERAVPFLAEFVEMIQAAGAIPTVEHMPPVLRMRRADYVFTPIGMASADFHFLLGQVSGLRTLADTSHAGLYLNARRLAPDPRFAWSQPLHAYLEQLPEEPRDLVGFMAALPELENAQLSNAAGVLGEGLAYAEGDFDLNLAARWLAANVRHIVTETLEVNNDEAVLMRDALRRMRLALA